VLSTVRAEARRTRGGVVGAILLTGIGADLRLCFDPARPPHPALSRDGERVLRIPSLTGGGRGRVIRR
jgi:hypothetical protein